MIRVGAPELGDGRLPENILQCSFWCSFVRLQGKPVFLLDSFTKNIHDWRVVMGVVLGAAVLKTKIWL